MSPSGSRAPRPRRRQGELRLKEPPPRAMPSLQEAVKDVRSILIFSHMNPDPDTVGAALGLQFLLTESYAKEARICYRGMIGRAENRQLMRLLGNSIVPARQLDQTRFDAAILVDSQPDYGYVPELDRLPVLGVIDHHPLAKATSGIPFADVRPDYGSTSTIVTEYLRDAGLDPGPQIATALFYGLKTDTLDLTRRTSPPDVGAYNWLLPRIDRRILTQIENPPLSRAYYEKFVAAVGRAMVYGRTVMTEIGWMTYPDMVAEIADRFIRLEGMEWSVCFGAFQSRIYLSVRTSHPTHDAGILVKAVLAKDGIGGGHDTMAAGRVELPETNDVAYLKIVSELWSRFLRELEEDPASGHNLVEEPKIDVRVTAAGNCKSHPG